MFGLCLNCFQAPHYFKLCPCFCLGRMDVCLKTALTLKWSRMGDPTFKRHFRMDRRLFEVCFVVMAGLQIIFMCDHLL